MGITNLRLLPGVAGALILSPLGETVGFSPSAGLVATSLLQRYCVGIALVLFGKFEMIMFELTRRSRYLESYHSSEQTCQMSASKRALTNEISKTFLHLGETFLGFVH